jgi:predicted aminopeptidase
MIKRILFILGLFTLVYFTYYNRELSYGIGQLKGQIHVLYEAVDIEEVLNSKDYPDSLKVKLRQIKEIKTFAIEGLGLKKSDNYTTIFDQKGKEILWNVSACPPFELKAHEWEFPIAGKFPYKGFFNLEKALKEEQIWKDLGMDTRVRSVSGWSTLGWFNDPILSNMLFKSEGDLANTIIHELTHQTIFIKSEVEINENLATFVGDFGTQEYLKYKYGTTDSVVYSYRSEIQQEQNFSNYVIEGAKGLDSLYAIIKGESRDEKEKKKELYIRNWVQSIDLDIFPRYSNFKVTALENLPNNTFFMSFLRYNKLQNTFEEEYQSKYKGDLKKYISILLERYEN